MEKLKSVLEEIKQERARQDERWGEQNWIETIDRRNNG